MSMAADYLETPPMQEKDESQPERVGEDRHGRENILAHFSAGVC